MGSWSDYQNIISITDRQFDHLKRISGSQKIYYRKRIFDFFQQEPTIASALADIENEGWISASRVLDSLDEIIGLLIEIWTREKNRLREKLRDEDDEALDAYGAVDGSEMGTYEGNLNLKIVRSPDSIVEYCERVKKAVYGLEHFAKWTKDSSDETLLKSLYPLKNRFEHADRALEILSRSHPFFAFRRLKKECEDFNRHPPSDYNGLEFVEWWSSYRKTEEILNAERNIETVGGGEQFILSSDEQNVRESLVMQIGLTRSRISLIERFAARCEAFDAPRLRNIAADSSRPEAELTLELARYLFDHGMLPILDATVSGLRPDVLSLTSGPSLYVEAKQYDKSPRATVIDAYHQVWSTWARVRKTYPVEEAFLVIFRRAGTLVELPKIVKYRQLKLYAVVVDISQQGGSREKEKVTQLSELELLPQVEK